MVTLARRLSICPKQDTTARHQPLTCSAMSIHRLTMKKLQLMHYSNGHTDGDGVIQYFASSKVVSYERDLLFTR